ncbi:hypothetical protein GCM10009759_55290 [Kitasatospora saccharophila]|uniref:Uncharacterized protein n=1 Tax=Kitasatospora saccharophila TaxID=407973 RepID=A0ABP5J759_9ACTN
MSTDGLLEFLRARLDEDSDVIRASWNKGDVTSERYHGTPFDPSRAMAEVDAKRRILDKYEYWAKRNSLGLPDSVDGGREYGLEDAVQCLVLPYAAHPDYQPGWAPQA